MTIGKLSGQCDFGQKGQSYCNQRGQSCVAKRVKVAWLFHMEIKKPEDIQGIRFTKDGQTFKASQISREFSFARLNAQLSWKTSESQQASERKVQQRIPDGGHLLESTGPGLFSPKSDTAPEEPLPQEELLRRRRKKKRRKGFGL